MTNTIIAQFYTKKDRATRPGRVILVDRNTKIDPDRYVTAWQGRANDDETIDKWDVSWCWGHYFESLEEAQSDFAARCARGY